MGKDAISASSRLSNATWHQTKWEFQTDAGIWQALGLVDVAVLEARFKECPHSEVQIQMGPKSRPYRINFLTSIQTNVGTGKQRPLRRLPTSDEVLVITDMWYPLGEIVP